MSEVKHSGLVHQIASIAILLSLALLFPWSAADPKLTLLILRGSPILIIPLILIWYPGSMRKHFSSHATERDVRCWGSAGLFLLAIPCWAILLGLFR